VAVLLAVAEAQKINRPRVQDLVTRALKIRMILLLGAKEAFGVQGSAIPSVAKKIKRKTKKLSQQDAPLQVILMRKKLRGGGWVSLADVHPPVKLRIKRPLKPMKRKKGALAVACSDALNLKRARRSPLKKRPPHAVASPASPLPHWGRGQAPALLRHSELVAVGQGQVLLLHPHLGRALPVVRLAPLLVP
jgi:hypothetical protein